ncbi:hypothetical protein C5167_036482 [Papaver somniferum]|uniref:Pentacotripeptide-repeat region of PRORP domain-containing protein n=1 Tax=Papaver somniferum TaxID=3469 RepID=A0A4Y7I3T3_PAPSO|nr:hypothetical protein C5167_036482 [Papaver somniferum]
MPSRNVVSWTAIISGYSQNGLYDNALEMCLRMEGENGVPPNEVTLASVLPACANLGASEIGERIETYARGKRFLRNIYVSNALLEMYAKCGKIDAARRIFDEIGSKRDLCTWNSKIMCMAVHGRSMEGLELFHEMVRGGTAPDDVTFVGVLLACTHDGLVEEAYQFFKSMKKDFSITPKLEHYSCIVDLLGRAGKLKEAYDLIKSCNTEYLQWKCSEIKWPSFTQLEGQKHEHCYELSTFHVKTRNLHIYDYINRIIDGNFLLFVLYPSSPPSSKFKNLVYQNHWC